MEADNRAVGEKSRRAGAGTMTAREMGVRLEALRRGRGLSQLELAERLDTSRQAVSKWETGASLPSTENLLALSALYGVTLDELVKGDGPAAPAEESAPAAETTPPEEAAPDQPPGAPGEEERQSRRAGILRLALWGAVALVMILLLLLSMIDGPSVTPG